MPCVGISSDPLCAAHRESETFAKVSCARATKGLRKNVKKKKKTIFFSSKIGFAAVRTCLSRLAHHHHHPAEGARAAGTQARGKNKKRDE